MFFAADEFTGTTIQTDGFGAITLSSDVEMNFQIRSIHIGSQTNTSRLAISLDGGITYRISGFSVANDGIAPPAFANNSSSSLMGGQGNIPTGDMVGGTGQLIRRWNLKITPNQVISDENIIGLEDTSSREFKIGLFENVSVDVNDSQGIVDLSAANGSPVEIFTIVQAGFEIGDVVPEVGEDVINDGDSII